MTAHRSSVPISTATNGDDLDATIARAEQRLVDNEASIKHTLDDMLRRTAERSRTLAPAAGAGAGLLALAVWQLRRYWRARSDRRPG